MYIYIHTRLREGRVTQGEQVGTVCHEPRNRVTFRHLQPSSHNGYTNNWDNGWYR